MIILSPHDLPYLWISVPIGTVSTEGLMLNNRQSHLAVGPTAISSAARVAPAKQNWNKDGYAKHIIYKCHTMEKRQHYMLDNVTSRKIVVSKSHIMLAGDA